MRVSFLALCAMAAVPAIGQAADPAPSFPSAVTNNAATAVTTPPAPRQVDAPGSGFTLTAGTGRVLHLPGPASNVFTADPKIAEVRPASADSLFVFGVGPGTTTVAALSAAGAAVGQYMVTVLPSGFDAAEARSAIARVTPENSIITRDTETGVSLSGGVATPGDADRAVAAAHGVLPPDAKIDNRMTVGQPVQVSLHVRIAEMSRTLTRELGVNWSGTSRLGNNLGQKVEVGVSTNNLLADTAIGPSSLVAGLFHKGIANFEAAIDALSQDQLVHVLAEPNLTAMSGETASFLVGGEFPIPVATNNNTISLDFKQYGISLTFVPTVIDRNRITLHVRPEVSQLDPAHGVTLLLNSGSGTGLQIPGLTVRRADTTVELGSGQSFVIAGLLSDQTKLTGLGVPGLGDLPVLGALFRSDSFQRDETELVIVVTPYIVEPVSDPNALHLPTDGWKPPTDIERILLLRQSHRGNSGPTRRIPADAGFVVE